MKPDADSFPTRSSLLIRLKDLDDQKSWKEFYDTYWRLIYSTALKSGLQAAEAQDVVQETVIAVARKMPGFTYDRSKGSFKGWLLQLTRWQITDYCRKRWQARAIILAQGGDAAVASQVEQIPDPGFDLEKIWDAEWQQNLIAAATERVKRKAGAKQYQIFDSYVRKEWPVEDIMRTLGVSQDQIYQAKRRVSALLRKEIEYLEKKTL